MRPRELDFYNAKIVTPSEVIEGWVHICDGIIVDMGSGASSASAAIDMEGDYLLP